MASNSKLKDIVEHIVGNSRGILEEQCESYLLFRGETALGNGLRAFLYLLGLAYCFFGLSAITACFFRSMENVVKQKKEFTVRDPSTNAELTKYERVWNYTIADITLLAFGTSFPQISLATLDAIRNIGQLYAGGLGPGTLVGSAAFDLFPIHAVCVVVPKAGTFKKISDIGVWLVELFWSFWAYIWLYIILEVWTPNVITLWEALLTVLQFGLLLLHAYAQDMRWPYFSIPIARSERPEDWVPVEPIHNCDNDESDECSLVVPVDGGEEDGIVDIFSIHYKDTGPIYKNVPDNEIVESSDKTSSKELVIERFDLMLLWRQQFHDALKKYALYKRHQHPRIKISSETEIHHPIHLSFGHDKLESRKMDNIYLWIGRTSWQIILAPWRFLFAFVPPYHIAHGWVAFICSLIFISGIAYIVTKLTDLICCVTGINAYVIAFTALAGGTSWPDLVASKIAAERQTTADSAIANITCSNSVNIYVGIGIPWLINTAYNFFVYNEPLYIKNADGLSFSLLVFFATSIGCISVLVFRRLTLGAELGGPRLWAWVTCVYFMFLWVVFVVLSSLRISGII